jgi:phosphate transport system permease protein
VRPRAMSAADVAVLAGAALSALALVWLVLTELSGVRSKAALVFAWLATFLVIYWLVVREREGRLAAVDRVVSVLIAFVALALLVPLTSILVFVTSRGLRGLSANFFTQTLQSVGPLDPATAGGALHAVVGTLEQIGLAALISLPLSLLSAILLTEVRGPLARPVRVFVNALSGTPSIVAGLFIFAIWVVGLHKGFSGLAASFALAILMIPTITRTAEEVLRLVPDGLREASFALGAPEWRTTWRVVLPTARAGLVTAVILGVARAIGETAPLIMTSFGASLLNANPAHGAQESLPLYIYRNVKSSLPSQIQRAYTGAFVLIALVLGLFALARVVGGRRGIHG